MLGPLAVSLGALMLVRAQSRHAEERARKTKEITPDRVAGYLADLVSSGTFPAGYYAARIYSSAYSARRTPLDDALRSGAVELVEAASFGPRAAKMWIKIRVLSDWKGPAAHRLDEWATWFRVPPTLTAADALSPSESQDPILDAADAVKDRALRLGAAVERAGNAARTLAIVAGGAVVLGLFMRARGK